MGDSSHFSQSKGLLTEDFVGKKHNDLREQGNDDNTHHQEEEKRNRRPRHGKDISTRKILQNEKVETDRGRKLCHLRRDDQKDSEPDEVDSHGLEDRLDDPHGQ